MCLKDNGSDYEVTLLIFLGKKKKPCRIAANIKKSLRQLIWIRGPSHFKCNPASPALKGAEPWGLLLSLKRHQLSISSIIRSGVLWATSSSLSRYGREQVVTPPAAAIPFLLLPTEALLGGSLCQLGSRGLPASQLMTRLLLAPLLLYLPLPPSARVTLAKWVSPSCSWPKCNSSFIPPRTSPPVCYWSLSGQSRCLVVWGNAI